VITPITNNVNSAINNSGLPNQATSVMNGVAGNAINGVVNGSQGTGTLQGGNINPIAPNGSLSNTVSPTNIYNNLRNIFAGGKG
jgi:hypothetical protein